MTNQSSLENYPRLVLASQSPRREQLMRSAGYHFEVIHPDPAAEADFSFDGPFDQLVQQLALRKAADVAARISDGLVIGCDTVACCQQQLLGKPLDQDDARRMLRLMRGQRHSVLTGICLWHRPSDTRRTAVAKTTLQMDLLRDEQIENYLATSQWQGKAGGFGFQDRLEWIQILEGSESNVVGLPMDLLDQFLQQRHWENSAPQL